MRIKIYFSDFWKGFDLNNNYIVELLSQYSEVEVTLDCELLFYGPFGNEFKRFNCVKCFFTGENVNPNYLDCDFSLSFSPNSDLNFHFPWYAWYNNSSLILNQNSKKFLPKSKFCNFVYSNNRAEERQSFFRLLNDYKRVDSGGKVLNNLGYLVDDKFKFLEDYKFTICFENESCVGYTSEKIYDAMLSGSIPIYWGNPEIGKEFNTKSFVNVHEFSTFENAIEYVKMLDLDDFEYKKILSQPFFINDVIPDQINNDFIWKFIKNQYLNGRKKSLAYRKIKSIYSSILRKILQ